MHQAAWGTEVVEIDDGADVLDFDFDEARHETLVIEHVRVDTSTVRDLKSSRSSTSVCLALTMTSPPSSWHPEPSQGGDAKREGPRGVLDTALRFTAAGKKWDEAYRKLCRTLGLGHKRPIPKHEIRTHTRRSSRKLRVVVLYAGNARPRNYHCDSAPSTASAKFPPGSPAA